jgi:ABC-type ATPase with predicted acetyltransferase domain
VRLFGIRRKRLQERTEQRLTLEVGRGQVVFITGASGAGKSVLLNALYEQAPADQRLRLEDVALVEGKSVIDCIAETQASAPSMTVCLETLNKAGLSDVFCMLREPKELSEGQQARYRMAMALMSGRRLIFADEFTASMDRITAAVVAHHVRKTARQTGRSFILASCHEDILGDLRPDVVVAVESGQLTVIS